MLYPLFDIHYTMIVSQIDMLVALCYIKLYRTKNPYITVALH